MSQSYQIAHALDRFVRQVDAEVTRRMRTLDTDRIGPLGGFTILYLSDSQPTSIHALSERMGRDNSQMTRVLRGLEAKGVISRRTDPTDRRATLIALTDKGEDFLKVMRQTLSDAIDTVTAPLTEEECEQLRAILHRLLKA